MRLCSALGDMPAGEGFGVILGAAVNGLIALALIFTVLIIMNKIHKNDEVSDENSKNKDGSDEVSAGKEENGK